MVRSVDKDAGVAEEAPHVASLAVECRVAQWRVPGVGREGGAGRCPPSPFSPAFPFVGIARCFKLNCLAIETAKHKPLALKDPVGSLPSSFTKRLPLLFLS